MQKGYCKKPRIVKLEDGTLGTILIGPSYEKTKRKELFYPLNYGHYYETDLALLDTLTYTEATEEDYIQYITESFVWGPIIKVHTIAEYQIIEYEQDGITLFHPYINYNDTSTSYEALDRALTGAICEKFEGGNGRADIYLWMILDNYKD